MPLSSNMPPALFIARWRPSSKQFQSQHIFQSNQTQLSCTSVFVSFLRVNCGKGERGQGERYPREMCRLVCKSWCKFSVLANNINMLGLACECLPHEQEGCDTSCPSTIVFIYSFTKLGYKLGLRRVGGGSE